MKMIHELGKRTRETEEEVQVYREVLTKLAARAGIAVPEFSGGPSFDAERMREWIGEALAEEGEKAGGGRGRGGSSRGRGRGGTTGPRVKRARGAEEGEGVEGRRPHSG